MLKNPVSPLVLPPTYIVVRKGEQFYARTLMVEAVDGDEVVPVWAGPYRSCYDEAVTDAMHDQAEQAVLDGDDSPLALPSRQAQAAHAALVVLGATGRATNVMIEGFTVSLTDTGLVIVSTAHELERFENIACFAAAYGVESRPRTEQQMPFTVCHINAGIISVEHVMAASADAAFESAKGKTMLDPVVFPGHMVAHSYG